MIDVILFHHAQGLTNGVREFANELRTAGHHVTVPDLYGGVSFETLDDGIGHAEQIGFDTAKWSRELDDSDVASHLEVGLVEFTALPPARH
jgi:dienelactone hydrolase